jgi:hypothetical protein
MGPFYVGRSDRSNTIESSAGRGDGTGECRLAVRGRRRQVVGVDQRVAIE